LVLNSTNLTKKKKAQGNLILLGKYFIVNSRSNT